METVTTTGADVLSYRVSERGNVAEFVSDSRKTSSGLKTVDTFGNDFNVPDYTIKDILSAIPKKCYERSLVKSL